MLLYCMTVVLMLQYLIGNSYSYNLEKGKIKQCINSYESQIIHLNIRIFIIHKIYFEMSLCGKSLPIDIKLIFQSLS